MKQLILIISQDSIENTTFVCGKHSLVQGEAAIHLSLLYQQNWQYAGPHLQFNRLPRKAKLSFYLHSYLSLQTSHMIKLSSFPSPLQTVIVLSICKANIDYLQMTTPLTSFVYFSMQTFGHTFTDILTRQLLLGHTYSTITVKLHYIEWLVLQHLVVLKSRVVMTLWYTMWDGILWIEVEQAHQSYSNAVLILYYGLVMI